MRSITLTGVNASNKPAQLSKDVDHFTDSDNYFFVSYVNMNNKVIKLVTSKGTYLLKKHATQNIYMGTCAGRKVHVSLKKVVGELRYW